MINQDQIKQKVIEEVLIEDKESWDLAKDIFETHLRYLKREVGIWDIYQRIRILKKEAEAEPEQEIERLAGESGKKRLVIRVPEPGAADQQYHVIIGDSETVGFSLLATVAVALTTRISDYLSKEDQKILKGILEVEALSPVPEEKPKTRRGRRPKVEV